VLTWTATAARAGGAPPPLAPQLTNVAQSAQRWRLGNALPRYARATPPVGTTFRFTLDIRAQVKFEFTQVVTGRRVGGNCVPATNRNRSKPHCQHIVVAAMLHHRGKIGNNSLHLPEVPIRDCRGDEGSAGALAGRRALREIR
jgi:hypothetical protein